MHAFLEKVRGVIRQNGTAKQESLIRLLNPILRGWADYHRHISASSAYRKAEMVLWQSLWRWAKRRHLKKSTAWVANRYWHRLGRGKRVFAVLAGDDAPRSRAMEAWLVDPTKTSIQRHVKVRSNANPFDAYWRDYFEARESLKQASGKHRLRAL